MNNQTKSREENPLKVLFVCTGNTCRSPMAQAIAEKLQSEQAQLPSIEYCSAGLAAFAGESISPLAVQVLSELDIDFSQHRAHRLTSEMLAQADLILTMTNAQRNALLELDDSQIAKTFVLNRYINAEPVDIADPFGGSEETYRQTANQLHNSIGDLLEKFKNSLAQD
ncbi:MAG: low molecular weight protein arginine phosphatase [Firmicutes bacterium]|nr:low molecular weight protein arginine phosphatase [Bacillota bacterium]